jgi:hypothetical protein
MPVITRVRSPDFLISLYVQYPCSVSQNETQRQIKMHCHPVLTYQTTWITNQWLKEIYLETFCSVLLRY